MEPKSHYIMCPVCGSKNMMIQATIWANVFEENGSLVTTVPEGEQHNWDFSCPAHCEDCNWYGNARDAIMTEAPNGCLMVNAGKEV